MDHLVQMGVPEVIGSDVPYLMMDVPNFVKDVQNVLKDVPNVLKYQFFLRMHQGFQSAFRGGNGPPITFL